MQVAVQQAVYDPTTVDWKAVVEACKMIGAQAAGALQVFCAVTLPAWHIFPAVADDAREPHVTVRQQPEASQLLY
jgi:hypothetical protein